MGAVLQTTKLRLKEKNLNEYDKNLGGKAPAPIFQSTAGEREKRVKRTAIEN